MIYRKLPVRLVAANSEPFRSPRSSPGPMLDLEFAQLSDRGRVREHNEDYIGSVIPATPAQVRSQGWLFALADGVGGHEHGEVASRLAVEGVCAGFRSSNAKESHRALLPRLLQAANTSLLDAAAQTKTRGPAMATTFVACALRFDRAVVAHVGDSRCYLIRRGRATLLTRDHTMANEQIRLGVLSKRDAGDSPLRHMLSRSLGSDLFVNVDVDEQQILPGDVLLLCSDGMHGAVPEAEIVHIASRATDLNAAAQELVATANQRDGGDNVSVQLVRVRSVERMGMYRGRPYNLQ